MCVCVWVGGWVGVLWRYFIATSVFITVEKHAYLTYGYTHVLFAAVTQNKTNNRKSVTTRTFGADFDRLGSDSFRDVKFV